MLKKSSDSVGSSVIRRIEGIDQERRQHEAWTQSSTSHVDDDEMESSVMIFRHL